MLDAVGTAFVISMALSAFFLALGILVAICEGINKFARNFPRVPPAARPMRRRRKNHADHKSES